jgi:hypothetical protein
VATRQEVARPAATPLQQVKNKVSSKIPELAVKNQSRWA